MAKNVTDVNSADEYQKALDEAKGKYVLVDFWAEWCGPCKAAGPVIEKLAAEYEDRFTVIKVDVDQNQDIAGRYGVMSIPTMFLYTPADASKDDQTQNEKNNESIMNDDDFTKRQFSASVGFRPEPAMKQWFEATGMSLDAA